MKKLTGNIEIELTDVDTGAVETYSETNMVTNAVNDILGVNPMGVMYKAAGNYDDLIVWNDNLLPICPNMIGGILLFGSSINEEADNLYLPSTNLPVAYASNDVNATANTKRGSMNLTESMALTNGYKFVWEFTASQGNGTIAAIGLTSKQGGANAYGSEVGVDTTLLQIRKISLDDDDGFINDLFRTVTIDFENAKLYSLSYASNTVTIKRYRIPVFDIGLNEKLDDSTLVLEDTTVLQCGTFKFYGSYTPYGIFMDGGDGYWYGFSNQANSSGDATMLWIKIKQSDYSFTEGSWTLSNATLMVVGSFKEGSSYPSGSRNAVVRNGYMYVPSYDKTGVYKINISNSTDVTLIDLGFTANIRNIGETGSCDCCMTLINDIIVAYSFEIDVNDNVIESYAGERCGNISTPFFRYKEYIFAWGGAYLNQYRYPFSGRIKCGECGGWYGSKVWHSNDKYRSVIWRCNKKYDGCKCSTPTLRDADLQDRFVKAANIALSEKDETIKAFDRIIKPTLDTAELEKEQAKLLSEMTVIAEMVNSLVAKNAHTVMDQGEFRKQHQELADRYEEIRARHDAIEKEIEDKHHRLKGIEDYLKALGERDGFLAEFDESFWHRLVDTVTVYSEEDVRFQMKDGTEIKV